MADMTRAYRSTLREEQAKATRQRIVDALVEQASERGRTEFSIAEVAARAGVAERTVYRYFPTREALLDAVSAALDALTQSEPKSPDDVEGHVRALFAWFEDNAQLIEASHATGVGSEVRARGRRQRGARTKAMLDVWLADLPEPDRRRAFAVFRSMFGSFTWRTMRSELGLSAEETVDAVDWVLGLVMADLAKRSQAAAKAPAKKGSTARAKKRSREGGAR